jgi:hypothetical protein
MDINMTQKQKPKDSKPEHNFARQLDELTRQKSLRKRQATKMQNKLMQESNRWQRFVRYVWDKKKG